MINKYKKELEGWGFDIPGFEGTWDALDKLSLYNDEKICHYSGLRSTESYMEVVWRDSD